MAFFDKKYLLAALTSMIMIVSSLGEAVAEMTNWVDLGGGRARLVSIFNPVSGAVEGIIDVELLPGWTTYWRNPGEAGIPPNFDFSSSKGVAVNTPEFPVPIAKTDAGIVTIGYKKHVAFPFTATPLISPLSGKLKLDMLIGVCEAICIPAVASFEQDLSNLNKSDLLSTSLINTARNGVPVKDANDASRPQVLDVKRISQTLVNVRTRIANGDNPLHLFAEGKPSWYFNPGKIIKRDGDIIVFQLDLQDLPSDADLSKTPILLTLAADGVGSERSVFLDK